MTERMNPAVKAKWVAALRSGEYAQTTGALRMRLSNDTVCFCCLGVLCDIYAAENGLGEWKLSQLEDEEAALPNQTVAEWAGFEERDFGIRKDPVVVIDGEERVVSAHNDSGATFSEIADAIEAQL